MLLVWGGRTLEALAKSVSTKSFLLSLLGVRRSSEINANLHEYMVQ